MLKYEIHHTFAGGPIDHSPVKIFFTDREEFLHLHIEGPYFNDPPPKAPVEGATWELWKHEGLPFYILTYFS